MKNIKNLFFSLLVTLGIVSSVQGFTLSQTFTANQFTNFTSMLPGPVKVTQIILVSSSTNNSSVQFWDTPTNTQVFTNSAYTNLISYATNYVSTWTNYYGATNSVTNISLIDATNTVAATTNNYPLRISLAAGTNASIRADNVNYYFTSGVWVSNVSTNPATITITFQQ
jgi:hypothetical protein